MHNKNRMLNNLTSDQGPRMKDGTSFGKRHNLVEDNQRHLDNELSM